VFVGVDYIGEDVEGSRVEMGKEVLSEEEGLDGFAGRGSSKVVPLALECKAEEIGQMDGREGILGARVGRKVTVRDEEIQGDDFVECEGSVERSERRGLFKGGRERRQGQ
jgi:hypothetical protein